MKTKTYAGIGSRESPDDVLNIMTNFATLAEELGWKLRSGGADGADKAFEAGVKNAANKQIFLPWGAFNNSSSMLFPPSQDAMKIASEIHPNWDACTAGAKKLHARNVHQILGQHLNDPVQFVLCWTKDGRDVGGTALALRLARLWGIPIFNMGTEIDEGQLEYILRDMCPQFLRK